MTFVPHQCSEREANGDEDCTWCSSVMLQNAAHGANVTPSTRREYEALRVAGGDGPAENPGDGSRLDQAALGMFRRYGWHPTRIGPPGASHPSFAALWDRMPPGTAVAAQGWMGVFTRDSHWRRWDPQFGGAHCVCGVRRDATDRIWWLNPSAPNTYAGEWMSKADFKRYWDGWFGGALIARVGSLGLPDTSTGDLMKSFAAPQHPSQATSLRATKLWTDSTRTGTSVSVPAGHTKRFSGGPSPATDGSLVIVHDRDSSVDGKSNLFGDPDDWSIREIP